MSEFFKPPEELRSPELDTETFVEEFIKALRSGQHLQIAIDPLYPQEMVADLQVILKHAGYEVTIPKNN